MTLKKEKPFKKILKEVLPNDDIELLYYDEAFFRRKSTVTRGWFLRGHKSTVECPMTFEKIGVCGAVNPRDGALLSLIFDGFDSNTFVYYLKWLLKKCKTDKKIVLMLDNATSHKSHKVKKFIKEQKGRIELLYLPPYSPDLNPIERIWKNLRYNVTHNVYFENIKKLESAVTEYLIEHSLPNKKLISLCCNN